MKYQSASILSLVIACVGCPLPSEADAGSSMTSDAMSGSLPDTPAPGSEATSGTDVASSGGDVTPGDGDGDTGSEVVPASLIVESNGERIGYLLGVYDYGFIVWDDINEITFRVSQQTGNVADDVFGQDDRYYLYTSADCTGDRHIATEYAYAWNCSVAAPSRRKAMVIDGSSSGQVAGFPVVVTSGTPFVLDYQSIQDAWSGECFANSLSACAMHLDPTDVIPVTFPLPITVSESPP
jgi:hypothetical protein